MRGEALMAQNGSDIKEHDIIGKNKPKIDAREKVTGTAIFADDIQFGPNLLYATRKLSQ
jgi:xanthine dehydrogenase molybdopterin-binding subunit B